MQTVWFTPILWNLLTFDPHWHNTERDAFTVKCGGIFCTIKIFVKPLFYPIGHDLCSDSTYFLRSYLCVNLHVTNMRNEKRARDPAKNTFICFFLKILSLLIFDWRHPPVTLCALSTTQISLWQMILPLRFSFIRTMQHDKSHRLDGLYSWPRPLTFDLPSGRTDKHPQGKSQKSQEETKTLKQCTSVHVRPVTHGSRAMIVGDENTAELQEKRVDIRTLTTWTSGTNKRGKRKKKKKVGLWGLMFTYRVTSNWNVTTETLLYLIYMAFSPAFFGGV